MKTEVAYPYSEASRFTYNNKISPLNDFKKN